MFIGGVGINDNVFVFVVGINDNMFFGGIGILDNVSAGSVDIVSLRQVFCELLDKVKVLGFLDQKRVPDDLKS
ncbi:hypothetical protein DPMN_173671 [Dreissena polymorpha]|uniref:Uncharacterized protein n=1 Tax=Dreissena polymorpha TaxID=45954 RepID=A0A9D4E523_DREPO|nr:hypothetical protein DPMN_173671 [Dreissena polymorpha]